MSAPGNKNRNAYRERERSKSRIGNVVEEERDIIQLVKIMLFHKDMLEKDTKGLSIAHFVSLSTSGYILPRPLLLF